MHPIDEKHCPRCHLPNACAIAAGNGDAGDGCWCRHVAIPAAALAGVPAAARNRSCLCRACATAASEAPAIAPPRCPPPA